jgi:hypothetical protein|nr:MAG TPA: hypothetical protein [Crassvirales sp.]
MAKKMEESIDFGAIDDSPISVHEVSSMGGNEPPARIESEKKPKPSRVVESCLRNERVIIRHVPKEGGLVTNPKHILYGGMAESAVRYFTVPILGSSGAYKNVLTDDEKTFLEEIMGLEYNALSIYKKENNYWDNYQVRLTKQDNYLDLSVPDDYIKYKVLKANSDFIADSLETLQDKPKVTYQFVMIREGEQESQESEKMSATMKCYMEYGRIKDDRDALRCIIELIDGRPVASNSKLEFLQGKINNLIQADSKLFLKIITDPLLSTKVLISKAIEAGVISKRGDQLYLRSDNSPLCDHNEDPTLNVAARYLNLPKNQELKLSIEAKVK